MRFKIKKSYKFTTLVLLLFLMTITNRTNADELTVLPYKTGEQLPADMMRAYLLEQAEKSWQRWKRKYEKYKKNL